MRNVIIIIVLTCKFVFIYYISFSGQFLSLSAHVFVNNYWPGSSLRREAVAAIDVFYCKLGSTC
jgi:hypothetical protein